MGYFYCLRILQKPLDTALCSSKAIHAIIIHNLHAPSTYSIFLQFKRDEFKIGVYLFVSLDTKTWRGKNVCVHGQFLFEDACTVREEWQNIIECLIKIFKSKTFSLPVLQRSKKERKEKRRKYIIPSLCSWPIFILGCKHASRRATKHH